MEFTKNGIVYNQRPDGTLFCSPLDQSKKVGGAGEELRNQVQNKERLQRIRAINPNPILLDYGCGHGLFVQFLQDKKIKATGYDPYNEKFSKKPIVNFYNIVTLIEVIEHTTEPYSEIDEIWNYLKPGGTLFIETSFVDWMMIPDDPYIAPELGHSTIFSHRGLDLLLVKKKFKIAKPINMNVRLYYKPYMK